MIFKIEEKFSVNASYDNVFDFFTKPENMFPCIPGAELISKNEDGSFEGKVKAKVGPTTLTYKGMMQYEEIDKGKGYMKLSGKGRDLTGAGGAKAKIESFITKENENINIIVKVEADISGRVIQFGRGMIEQIARQMFKDFSSCAKEFLEQGSISSDTQQNELKVGSLIIKTIKNNLKEKFKGSDEK